MEKNCQIQLVSIEWLQEKKKDKRASRNSKGQEVQCREVLTWSGKSRLRSILFALPSHLRANPSGFIVGSI